MSLELLSGNLEGLCKPGFRDGQSYLSMSCGLILLFIYTAKELTEPLNTQVYIQALDSVQIMSSGRAAVGGAT